MVRVSGWKLGRRPKQNCVREDCEVWSLRHSLETYTYLPHGVLVGGGGNGLVNPHRFKGDEWDAESALYYMRASYSSGNFQL